MSPIIFRENAVKSTSSDDVPRIGGIRSQGNETIPWTGGSNLPTLETRHPTSLLAFRPQTFKDATEIEKALHAGLEETALLHPPKAVTPSGANVPKISINSLLSRIDRTGKSRMRKMHKKTLGW